MLSVTGCIVQRRDTLDPDPDPDLAVRETSAAMGQGGYLRFVDGHAYGVRRAEAVFQDARDPHARRNRVSAPLRHETLHSRLQAGRNLRARRGTLPPVNTVSLRPCRSEAIAGFRASLAQASRANFVTEIADSLGIALLTVYRTIERSFALRVE